MPEDKVIWETARKGTPGKLKFSLPYSTFSPDEGDKVEFYIGDKGIFSGYIFTISENGDTKRKEITAYDQLRYLKNKDNYVYKNKTASELLKMIAEDFSLKLGKIDATSYKIPYRVEDSKTLFDIIETALDLTYENTGEEYILYDDFGKLSLVKLNDLQTNLLIDDSSSENYTLQSSIDKSYNKIKLLHEDNRKNLRKIYLKEDKAYEEKYGVLQYFSHINGDENGFLKAEKLLNSYKNPVKSLSVYGVFGDLRVRAGSKLRLKITPFDNNMTVLKAEHIFYENEHKMNLYLEGGGIDE